MSEQKKFTARAWYCMRWRCSQPPRPVVLQLLAEIEAQLAAAGGLRPVALTVCTFPPGSFLGRCGEHLAVLGVTAAPGETLRRPLACWYQWQHPAWRFAATEESAGLPRPGAPAGR